MPAFDDITHPVPDRDERPLPHRIFLRMDYQIGVDSTLLASKVELCPLYS